VMTVIGTLTGIVVTNNSNTRRLRLQLEHDAREAERDRLDSLRRELYLKAVEASVKANAYFGNLPRMDFRKADFDLPLRDVLAVGAQLQLVVNQSTVELVAELIACYGELALRLMPKVMPVQKLSAQVETITALYEAAEGEVRRTLAAMTQYNESGQRDRDAFERLNGSATNARRTTARLGEQRASLLAQIVQFQRQYMKDLIPEIKKVMELQMRVMIELRQELNVGGDIQIFSQIVRRQFERLERASEEFDGSLPAVTSDETTN
jgi:hypothetical protein